MLHRVLQPVSIKRAGATQKYVLSSIDRRDDWSDQFSSSRG